MHRIEINSVNIIIAVLTPSNGIMGLFRAACASCAMKRLEYKHTLKTQIRHKRPNTNAEIPSKIMWTVDI
jgi:Fe-S cluster biogenesis protein NfuA